MNALGNFQWDKDYPTETVILNDIQKRHLYLLMAGSELLGLVCFNFEQPNEYQGLDWNTPSVALVIHRMIVTQHNRGKGIAKIMFQHAENTAKKLEVNAIRSDTNRENKAMKHLFKAYDYRFVGNIFLRKSPVEFNCYEKNIIL